MKKIIFTFALLLMAQNAFATYCTAECAIWVTEILAEIEQPDSYQEMDFNNYCLELTKGYATYARCDKRPGLSCNKSTKIATDVSGYGSNSYEASQDLRKSCATKVPVMDCDPYWPTTSVPSVSNLKCN